MIKLLMVLKRLGLLSPFAILRLILAIVKNGINVLALLDFAAKTYDGKVALVDDDGTISYKQLRDEAEKLAIQLANQYRLQPGHKVAILCKNHGSFVKAIFACSRLGVDLYFLNTEMSKNQLHQQLESRHFHLIIYDLELEAKIDNRTFLPIMLPSYHESMPSINHLVTLPINESIKIKKALSGKLMLLTGGTTGKPKEAAHQPSLFHYLDPFLALLNRLRLTEYRTAYIATPIYHGFGLAVLVLFVALGKKLIITKKFDAKKACSLIQTHEVEIITAVPLMVQKMIEENAAQMRSLKCMAAGSAVLQPHLIEKVFQQLGPILYNLYGTSEAGLMVIATPEDLQYSSKTIGRRIEGVPLKIMNEKMQEVNAGIIGQFCLQKGIKDFIKTGDLGYRDDNGYYFLCGRVDDMIVSGGVNVFPIELEQIINRHPAVADVSVIGVDDEIFGNRLVAFVQLNRKESVSKRELMDWTRDRSARYQIPKEIFFLDSIPYTPVGKPDKKKLANIWKNQ